MIKYLYAYNKSNLCKLNINTAEIMIMKQKGVAICLKISSNK